MPVFDFTGERALHPGITFGPYTFLLNSTKSSTVGVVVPSVPNNQFTLNGHGLSDGDQVRFSTDGTLPAGLESSFFYYVVSSTTNTFKVSETLGGPAIVITDAGSGPLTAYKRGQPLDLTGVTVWAWVKPEPPAPDSTKILDLHPTITDPTDGRIQVLLTDEETWNLENQPDAAWDMIIQALTGERFLIVGGAFAIVKVVTHPVEV
jgi:hypothetical protein